MLGTATHRHRTVTRRLCRGWPVPRSGCNTGERETRLDRIPQWSMLERKRDRESIRAVLSYVPTSMPVAAIWTGCRPRADGQPARNIGATNSTIQYYNPGNSNTSHRHRYNAVTAQHINRGCMLLARICSLSSVSLSVCISLLHCISLFPRGAASVPPPRLNLASSLLHVPTPIRSVEANSLACSFACSLVRSFVRSVSVVRSRFVSVPPRRATISDWPNH